MRMDRKVIFITGAASGIGAATARRYAGGGWFCVLTDIDLVGLQALARELGPKNTLIQTLDVRQRQAWAEAMRATAAATGGRLDVLFNNAGVAKSGPFETISPSAVDDMIDINLKGVINGATAALPLLERTPGARIINVASVAGIVGSPSLAVYSATKWGVRGFTEALDAELAGRDIRVVSLQPWFIDTPLLDKGFSGDRRNVPAKDAMRDMGIDVYPVEIVAETAWDAATGSHMHYPVGKRARQARFGMRFFPNAVRKRLRRDFEKGRAREE